ncbi:hypothetical protein EKK58_08565 [Candidatus Dependentiae bacterium]|nr:MAG: hypothetical protein EKK58_08565 [Candidatus Dependentiae bacterium]
MRTIFFILLLSSVALGQVSSSYNSVEKLTTVAPIVTSGTRARPIVSMPAVSSTNDGYLTSSQYNALSSAISGPANHVTGYAPDGSLSYVPGYTFNEVHGRQGIDLTGDAGVDGSFNFLNYELRSEPSVNNTSNVTSFNIDSHNDRNNQGFSIGNYIGLNIGHRLEGTGFAGSSTGLNVVSEIGNGSGASSANMQVLNTYGAIGAGSTLTYIGGINSFINASASTVTSGNVATFGAEGNFSQSFNIVNTGIGNAHIGQNLNAYTFFSNSSTTVDGEFRALNVAMDGKLNSSAGHVMGFYNGEITQNFTGYGIYSSNNTISNSGSLYRMFDGNMNNVHIDGGVIGFNAYLNGTSNTADTNIQAMNIVNQMPAYRFTGLFLQNESPHTEEIKMIQLNSNSNARTITGIDINLSGTATDDVRGLRLNMNGMNSSTQRVYSMEVSGGAVGIQSTYTPFNNATVDVGNNFTMTATVGSTLTGTDSIIQLMQSNLLVNADITTGPIGIDTNMLGLVSQVGVSGAYTVPKLRSMLLGTSVPSGSGGTITEHSVLTILGLPSFGGSVSNPTRVGIEDGFLLGQNFCLGATDCWFIKNYDETADNFLGKLALGTSSKKTSTNVKLEIHNGHVKHSQSTAPVATVDSNAGTSATCTLSNATDMAGTIALTTGSGSYSSGSQCSIAFNSSYGVAPRCVITPINSSSAVAVANVYISKTTTDLVINFVNADSVSTAYEWDYHCVETN